MLLVIIEHVGKLFPGVGVQPPTPRGEQLGPPPGKAIQRGEKLALFP